MKKIKKRYIALIVLVVVIAGGFLFRNSLAILAFDLFLSDRVESKLKEESYQPLKDENKVKPEPVVYKSDPFSLMLLGTDQRDNETARSDTMMYAVVRPEDYKILLISIPRDTYTEIIGHNDNKKIRLPMLMLLVGSKWLRILWKHCWSMIFSIMPPLTFKGSRMPLMLLEAFSANQEGYCKQG